ncbi:MAG: hypothetical protein K2W95_27970 [Candidatus Obscuribacterales bacterium]|nr:hypothetical protein [Candidatus Obscuribacterales bacterium]
MRFVLNTILLALYVGLTTCAPCPAAADVPGMNSQIGGEVSNNNQLPLLIQQTGPREFIVETGSCFTVSVQDELDSGTAAIGYPITATLTQDLRSGPSLLAPAGSRLIGHVSSVDPARRSLKADIPGKHWLDAQGAIGIEFDELVRTGDDRRFQMDAIPCPGSKVTQSNRTVQNVAGDQDTAKPHLRMPIEVDNRGDLTLDFHAKRNTLIHLALDGGAIAAGPFGLAIGPAANGIAGAISPSYAFGHPADMTGTKEREKGFLMGAVRGLPFVGFVADAAEKGRDVNIAPGDTMVVRLRSDMQISSIRK